jgi:hypothetical protein
LNGELLAILREGQGDRSGDLPSDLAARDASRRRRVEGLVAFGRPRAVVSGAPAIAGS